MARLRRSRELNLKILILCEGKTEKNYLLEIKNQLPREKQRGIQIDVEEFKRNDPLNLVNESIRRKQRAKLEGAPYDIIWVVFDHDNLPNRDKAFIKANSNSIEVAYSSINIEFWYVIHFQYSTKQFSNGDECKRYLTKNFIPDYKPGKTRMLPYLEKNLEKAYKNAVSLRLYKQAEIESGVKEWEANPYLTIDKLIEFMYGLKN